MKKSDITISVAEYAAVKGISRQTVYNRLVKDLSNHVKQVSNVDENCQGGVRLKSSAVTKEELQAIIESRQTGLPVDKCLTKILQGLTPDLTTAENAQETRSDALHEAQNQRIADLQKQIEFLQGQLDSANQSAATTLKLLDQEQQLHAAAQQRVLTLESKLKALSEPEPTPAPEDDEAEPIPTEDAAEVAPEEPEPVAESEREAETAIDPDGNTPADPFADMTMFQRLRFVITGKLPGKKE